MKLTIAIDGYRDGGTVSIHTNLGHYCIDFRCMVDDDDNVIDSPTRGMLFIDHPSKNNQLDLEESKRIKRALKSAIKVYVGSRAEYAKTHINNIKIPNL